MPVHVHLSGLAHPRRAALAVGAALSLALSACGGQSDADRIRAMLSEVAHKPIALCDKYATQGLLLRTGGRAACERAAAAPGARDPGQKVLDVRVNALAAVAHVRGRGGRNTVYLARIGPDWKVGNTD